jgi:hypothetical protein
MAGLISAAGRNVVKARWDRYNRNHPDKLKAKSARGKKAAK